MIKHIYKVGDLVMTRPDTDFKSRVKLVKALSLGYISKLLDDNMYAYAVVWIYIAPPHSVNLTVEGIFTQPEIETMRENLFAYKKSLQEGNL